MAPQGSRFELLSRLTYNAPLSPGNANRYLYAGGDPINVSDPLGLGFWDDVEEIAGDEFAGLVGCGSGILAVDDTGIGEAATAAGGPIGGAAANVIGCAVG